MSDFFDFLKRILRPIPEPKPKSGRRCPMCGGRWAPQAGVEPDRLACGHCWTRRGELWVERCAGQPTTLWARMTPGKDTLKLRQLGELRVQEDEKSELARLLGDPVPKVEIRELPFPQQYRCNRCGDAFNGMCMGSGVCYDCWGG